MILEAKRLLKLGGGYEILFSKQMLQRLPLPLAQVKQAIIQKMY